MTATSRCRSDAADDEIGTPGKRRRWTHTTCSLTAISLASIYGLLAIGISIIWSSLGMINLAQGFIFTVSGYGAWLVAQNISTNGFVVVAAGVHHRGAGRRAHRRCSPSSRSTTSRTSRCAA